MADSSAAVSLCIRIIAVVPEVKEGAHYVTKAHAGREAVENILKPASYLGSDDRQSARLNGGECRQMATKFNKIHMSSRFGPRRGSQVD